LVDNIIMEQKQENLNQPVTLKILGEFTEQVLLPAMRNIIKEELKGYATKDDLKEELKSYATKEDLKGFATKVEIYEILRDYPTRADLEEHKDEIIKVIRGKMENVVQHQTVVTDVIEKQGCAKPDELKILKESVS